MDKKKSKRGQNKKRKKGGTYLLRRHVEGDRPQINLAVGVNAGNDEEDAGPLGSPLQQSPQSEDDCPFVLLDNLWQKQFEHIILLVL